MSYKSFKIYALFSFVMSLVVASYLDTLTYMMKWDFNLESSQQLKIVVKVPVAEENVEEPAEGCVAIMFGFMDD